MLTSSHMLEWLQETHAGDSSSRCYGDQLTRGQIKAYM